MTIPTDLEAEMLEEVRRRVDTWHRRYRERPDVERAKLLSLAFEREQLVSVAYREEAIAGRIESLHADAEIKSLIRQTLVWIWKDEQMHAEFFRGELLKARGVAAWVALVGLEVQGVVSGWTVSTANHRDPAIAPVRAGLATILVAGAGLARQIPAALVGELRFQSFTHYCSVNVALELSAALGYVRYLELARSEQERETITRIHADEERHVAAFRVLGATITADDRPAPGVTAENLSRDLGNISPWFVPAEARSGGNSRARRRFFGSGGVIAIRSGSRDEDQKRALFECLDRAGLPDQAAGCTRAAIRASFMLGYDKRDRSNVNDPRLLRHLAVYLRALGVSDVAVLEAPTVYGNLFEGRSVRAVASYFGFEAPEHRVVDISQDLVPMRFERGFVQQAISGTWLDADIRIVMPKLRTDPTEFAHLCLSTLEGTTGPIDATFYAGRQVDFRSATMMLLDVAPPDFGVVDAWAPVADGPFGVMGCARPAQIRHIYAGADVLALDETVLADLGVQDASQAPIVRRAHHWFGLQPAETTVDGRRPRLDQELRGAHSSRPLRALGMASYLVYAYLSGDGSRFVPAMDTVAFPEKRHPTGLTRITRRLSQKLFGLHAP